MKLSKRLIALATLMAMLGTSGLHAQGEEFYVDNGGNGYDESFRSSSLAPAIALGTIALVAIIAVAVQNTSGHGHCHGHSSSSSS